jgi:hypothetical protein
MCAARAARIMVAMIRALPLALLHLGVLFAPGAVAVVNQL